MCGIVGKYSLAEKELVDEQIIRKMCSTIIHRGPDDHGIYVKNSIGLGMRRLSIIDLQGGRQPIFNEDKTVVIVYNGEAYNFLKLRDELKEQGHKFKTQTDTEVLVHAYEQYGIDFIKRIRGMFAFALWDERKKRLILARDRLGQKPLYYTEVNGTLWFCSEIKSILVDPLVERAVDLQSFDYYLTFNYIPAPRTIFKGIKKLPPGTMLICENGNTKLHKYWALDNSTNYSFDENECASILYDLLSESVKIRLAADVPLGAFLSGGIDSSIIVSLMAQHSVAPVKTFSIGFTDNDFSELEYARLVSQRFETEHHQHILTSDVKNLIPKLIWYYNEPVGDSSAIPTYYVSKMTRQYVTVALSGDGGDELFAGYGKYPLIQNILSKNPINHSLRLTLSKLIKSWDLGYLQFNSILKRIKDYVGYHFSTACDRDFIWISRFDNYYKSKIYSKDIKQIIDSKKAREFYESKLNKSFSKDTFSKILFVDLTSYLPDDLLIKVDIASMANSLEVRSPFLDHKFVEFAASIPNSLKLCNGQTKYVLRKAFESLIPTQILERKKMGFSIPIDKWFRHDLHEFSREILLSTDGEINRYFNQKFLAYMLDAHGSGARNYGTKLWLILNFVIWHDMFISNYDYSNA